MSAAIFCHGRSGISVLRKGSFLWLGLWTWQNSQFSTTFFISLEMACHHTHNLALSRHLLIPMWPSCMFCKVSVCNSLGITTLLWYMIRPCETESSLRTVMYGFTSSGIEHSFSGHPWIMNFLTFWRSKSRSVALIISFSFISDIGLWFSIDST